MDLESPFGMLMPERQWNNGNGYRYGFNGKENDNEVKGIEGSQQDYGMRIYDPRIGRFLSADPLTQSYPFYSPYPFAGNMPIAAIDLDGAEPKVKFNWGTITKDRTAIEVSADVNIKIQIINLSSMPSAKLDLEQVASNLKSDLANKLSGSNTVMWNLPFEFIAKDGYVQEVKMVKDASKTKNTSVTYHTAVSAQVSVVDDINKIDNNTWVFAIVDQVHNNGKDWGGMAFGVGTGKVAIGTAESFMPKNIDKKGRHLVFHEIAHLLGATDTYPPNQAAPEAKTPDNLMYNQSGLNLTPEQMVKEIWQSTIGGVDKLFREGRKNYKRPGDPSDNQPTQEQLKQHIQKNGNGRIL